MNHVAHAQSLTALATLVQESARGVRRRGRWTRCKLVNPVLGPKFGELVAELVRLGAEVRVLEGAVIWTPVLAEDGVVVWQERKAIREREHVTVEVALA